MILSLANALPENARVSAQITIKVVNNLFLMVTLLKFLVNQGLSIMHPPPGGHDAPFQFLLS
jgi:hypothetical protein